MVKGTRGTGTRGGEFNGVEVSGLLRVKERTREREREARFVVKPWVTMNASCRPDKNLVDFLCVRATRHSSQGCCLITCQTDTGRVLASIVAELTRRDISLD